MSTYYLPFWSLAYLGVVEINLWLEKRELSQLSAEEKGRLFDRPSRNPILNWIGMLVGALVFFVVLKEWPGFAPTFMSGLLILFVFDSIRSGVLLYRRLKKLSMPKHYATNRIIRFVVYYTTLLGLLLFFMKYVLP